MRRRKLKRHQAETEFLWEQASFSSCENRSVNTRETWLWSETVSPCPLNTAISSLWAPSDRPMKTSIQRPFWLHSPGALLGPAASFYSLCLSHTNIQTQNMGLELIKRPFGSSLWETSLLFAHKGMSVEFKKMREGEREAKKWSQVLGWAEERAESRHAEMPRAEIWVMQ